MEKKISDPKNAQEPFQYFDSIKQITDAECFSSCASFDTLRATFDAPANTGCGAFVVMEGNYCIYVLKHSHDVGLLGRQGNYRKSNFHRSLYVLTSNGFLHSFSLKNHGKKEDLQKVKDDPENVTYSINLRRAKVQARRSDVNINCFEILVPKSNRTLFKASDQNKFIIKAESGEEMMAWLNAIGKFLTSNREPPRLSLAGIQSSKRNESENAVVDEALS